jgi:hypothetical protein
MPNSEISVKNGIYMNRNTDRYRSGPANELDGYEADRKLAQMHVESAEIVVLGFQWKC